jgi:hypothetical protein
MPPFGHLHNMPTYVDSQLAKGGTIYMNAGNHKELLVLHWDSYTQLASPVIGDIAMAPGEPKNTAATAYVREPHELQGNVLRSASLMAEA